MEYSVGSLADLISGSQTPNKPKVIKKGFKLKVKKTIVNEKQKKMEAVNKKRKLKHSKDHENRTQELVSEKPLRALKVRKRKIADSVENTPEEVRIKETKVVANIKYKKNQSVKRNASSDRFDLSVDASTMMQKKNDQLRKFGDYEDNREQIQTMNNEIEKEHNERTVFVGNLPIDINKKILKKKFEKFGIVESVRLRSAPIADERVPKKVAIITKQFHKNRKSINAYIRFSECKGAREAIELNGTEYKNHHIRVKLCDGNEKPDQNKAIFLGNVSFDAEEEELWKLFESCGSIESVRLVRDRKTNVGKGFGYVNFLSADSVELALQMENVKLRDRELRISACDSKARKKVTQNIETTHDANKPGEKQEKTLKSTKDFQGKKTSDKKKRKFDKGNYQKKKLIKKIAPKS